MCALAGCVEGSVELVGGVLSEREGAVRVCMSGNFVPVSVEGLSILEASLLCRQAGRGQGRSRNITESVLYRSFTLNKIWYHM